MRNVFKFNPKINDPTRVLGRCFCVHNLSGNKFTNTFPDTYNDNHQRSIKDPEQYWAEIATNTVWTKPWDKVLDHSNAPFTKWFVGGKLNMCYNAVDRHVDEGIGDRKAIIWDSPITNSKRVFTYHEILDKVSALAGALVNLKVKKGDRVLIYMPMVPDAIIAMLACARLGAIHTVVFGGFAAKELAVRIRHCEPKVNNYGKATCHYNFLGEKP